jgi:NADH-quinone oxidoreductase subunit G
MLKQHKSQENEFITELYNNHIGKIGGPTAHKILHTHYYVRKRILAENMDIIDSTSHKLTISICVGTNCFMNGAQEIMSKMLNYVEEHNLINVVDVKANFCMENCDRGPTVSIGEAIISKATPAKVIKELESQLVAQQV